jgi:hypothetical protein
MANTIPVSTTNSFGQINDNSSKLRICYLLLSVKIPFSPSQDPRLREGGYEPDQGCFSAACYVRMIKQESIRFTRLKVRAREFFFF